MTQLDQNKAVDHKARCEIVRSLAAMVTAFIPQPNKEDCDNIARNLVQKYPCLCDVNGSGFVSLQLSTLVSCAVMHTHESV